MHLDRYAGDHFEWRSAIHHNHRIHYRPQGLVETAFDYDGIRYDGRSDIVITRSYTCETDDTPEELRERIILVLASLRLQHTMLLTRCTGFDAAFMTSHKRSPWERYLVLSTPASVQDAIQSTRDITTFLEDYYSDVDLKNFEHHCFNSSRIIDSSVSLFKVYVLPIKRSSHGTYDLKIVWLLGHNIADGMSQHAWGTHMHTLLNTPLATIRSDLTDLLQTISSRLIPPQEALYPRIPGNRARQRWFWAILHVLRHVRRPGPAPTPNPLYRRHPLPATLPPPTYAAVLPYNTPPTLNTGTYRTTIPSSGASHLHALCRATSSSIGAGLFVLIALSLPSHPFGGSFPLNPRLLLPSRPEAESCMLAFSPGIILPHLPVDLPLTGRFKLLLRLAQGQLRRYQKRTTAGVADRHAAHMLQNNFLDAHARIAPFAPDDERLKYPSEIPPTPFPRATCGVSSVGVMPEPPSPPEGAECRTWWNHATASVRAREGEFLVGISGRPDGTVFVNVSYDSCAVDTERVEDWGRRLGEITEELAGEIKARM